MKTTSRKNKIQSGSTHENKAWAAAHNNAAVLDTSDAKSLIAKNVGSKTNISRLDGHVNQTAQLLANSASKSKVLQAHRTEHQIRKLRDDINSAIAKAKSNPGIDIKLQETDFRLDEEVLLRTRQKVESLIENERTRRRNSVEQQELQEREAQKAKLGAAGDMHAQILANHGVTMPPPRPAPAPVLSLGDRVKAREEQNKINKVADPEFQHQAAGHQHGETSNEAKQFDDPLLAAERRQFRAQQAKKAQEQADYDSL